MKLLILHEPKVINMYICNIINMLLKMSMNQAIFNLALIVTGLINYAL